MIISPLALLLQPPSMGPFLLNLPLPKSGKFSMMKMIATITFQLPTNVLYIKCMFQRYWSHCLTDCKEPHDPFCIAQNKAKFQDERNCQSRDDCRMEDVLVVAKIIKVVQIMNGTSLE